MSTDGAARVLCVAFSPDDKRIYIVDTWIPGAVHRAAQVVRVPSGKGVNAARAALIAGAACTFTGFAHQEFIAGCGADDVLAHAGIRMAGTALPVRCCTTLIESSSGTSTEIVEEAPAVSMDEVEALRRAYADALADADSVLLAGSLPPGCPAEIYPDFIALAHARSIPVLVDAHGDALRAALKAHPDVVKITREEAARTLALDGADQAAHARPRTPGDATEDARVHARALRTSGAGCVVLTHGAGAVIAIDAEWRALRMDPPSVAPLNAIGSGDAFSGVLAHQLGMLVRERRMQAGGQGRGHGTNTARSDVEDAHTRAVCTGEAWHSALRASVAAASASAGTLVPAWYDSAIARRLESAVRMCDI